jgi:hypothetical protein
MDNMKTKVITSYNSKLERELKTARQLAQQAAARKNPALIMDTFAGLKSKCNIKIIENEQDERVKYGY